MKNQYRKKIQKKNLYKEFLTVLNGLLRLSDREVELLSLLMQLDDEWKPLLDNNKDILTTDRRRFIIEKTGITKTNLSKYLKQLKDKGILIENSLGGTEINSVFMPKLTSGVVDITFTLETE